MSYLLAAGDSWTDANFQSNIVPDVDCSFPKWPVLLGKQLGISEVVNVGKSGGSNSYMFQQCYDKIIAKKPKLVCILLSGWDRRNLFNYQFNTYVNICVHQMHTTNSFPEDGQWLKEHYNNHIDAVNMTRFLWHRHATVANVMIESLRDIFLFQSYCMQHNIDYIIMQGMNPIPVRDIEIISQYSGADGIRHTMDNYMKYLLDSPYTSKLNEQNLLGWPFFWQIGGYSAASKFTDMGYSELQLHPLDFHPNAIGQQVISNMFRKGYKDAYDKVS